MFGLLIDAALQPVRDAADIAEGLMEGEVRVKPAARLAVDFAAGVVVSEIMQAVTGDDD